jgi:hypothetical protein
MPEQWSEVGSEHSSVGTVGNGNWAAAGTDAEEAAADEAAVEEVAVEPTSAIEPTAAADATETTGDVAAGAAESLAASTADRDSAFLAELARAMQATAGAERDRIAEEMEQRRQEHIAQIRARQASEADRMRELADEELRSIDAWAEGERDRIQQERERRAAALNEDLETSLAGHGIGIDRDIERAEAAIAAYRTEVEAFFDGLERETDVVQIARQATLRPAFPSLVALPNADTGLGEVPSGTVGENATVDAGQAAEAPPAEPPADPPAEPTLVGVMDPEASGEDPAESWAPPAETHSEPAPAAFSELSAERGEAGEPASQPIATATTPAETSSSIFQSVQVLRPMSWLRRDPSGEDRSDREG